MSYLGDFQLETTFDFKFTTVDNTGLPVTLASGEVVVYEDNGISEITGAETLTLDFDGITGLHNCRIVATAANGFAVGSEYQVVISVGTIDSVSAVGYVVGSFSIENRAALMPTTNGRRLDVSAGGEAGLDWANIGSPSTAQDLAGTDIQLVGTCTTSTDMVGTDDALLAASAPANFGDMSITASTGLVDITQAAADKVWATVARVLTANTNFNDPTAAVIADAVWDELLTAAAHNTATSAGRRLRELADGQIIRDNSFQAGSTTTSLVLDASASAVDDFYNHTVIRIVNGVAAGQERVITDYVGSSRTATISPALVTSAPAAADDFEIVTGGSVHAETLGGGYSNGQVWVDTNNGVAGTELYVNGTIDNPVDSIADAITIATALKLMQLHFLPGSSVTLAADMSNFELLGKSWTLALGGQLINNTFISGATITGIGVSTTTPCTIEESTVGNVTLDQCTLVHCGLSGTITSGSASDYFFDDCFSAIAGIGTPAFDFGAALLNTNLNVRHYSGGIEIQNMGGAGTDNMSLEGDGQLVINASCSSGTVAVRGHFTITDNAGGAVTLSDDARFDVNQGLTIAVGGIVDGAIAAAELNNIADGCLDRRLDLGTDTGGNTTTSRTWRQALRTARNRVVVAAGVMTVYEEDDTTADFTAAVTTTAGDPITELNPS